MKGEILYGEVNFLVSGQGGIRYSMVGSQIDLAFSSKIVVGG